MVCAQCGEREAMVFIRRSGASGEARDIVLCEECARNRGIVAGPGSLDLDFDELIGGGADPVPAKAGAARCPSCGKELASTLKEGRLGCSACLDAFLPELEASLPLRRKGVDLVAEEEAFVASRAVAEGNSLRDRLEKAVRDEDYETAAALRDEIGGAAEALPGAGAKGHRPSVDYPFGWDSFTERGGPDGDVALWSSAWLFRNFDGIPFPGSPGGEDSSRALPKDKALPSSEWEIRSMDSLSPALRRSLAERGVAPRSYAASDGDELAAKIGAGVYALIGEADHLRLRAVRPGSSIGEAFESVLSAAAAIHRETSFSIRPGIGWICSRLADCGEAAALSILVHIPAISATGMRDRLFRALMAEGAAFRGYYSSGEESAGAIYELSVEDRRGRSPGDMAAALSRLAGRTVQAERRARKELAEKGRTALVDAEGRAFGVAKHCSLLGAEEASRVLSTLRLAALRGSLSGADPAALAGLLVSLGPATLAASIGLSSVPEGPEADRIRARAVKAALGKADYTDILEEGA